MKRRVLGIFQFVVAATMVPQVFFFGVPGLLGSLGMSESGHFDADLSGVPRLYYWSLLIASFSLVIATILAFAGAALYPGEAVTIQRSSVRGWRGFLLGIYRRLAGDRVCARHPLQSSLHDRVGRHGISHRRRRRSCGVRAVFPGESRGHFLKFLQVRAPHSLGFVPLHLLQFHAILLVSKHVHRLLLAANPSGSRSRDRRTVLFFKDLVLTPDWNFI